MDILNKLSNSINPIINNGVEFGFNFIVGAILLLIGYMIAKFLSKIVKKVFDSLNAEKYMDKVREVDLFSGITISLSELMQKLVFWLVMFITIMLCVDILGLSQVSEGINKFLAYLPRLFSALIFFVIATFFANFIRTVIKTTCDSVGVSAGNLISNILYYFMLIMIGIVALNQAGLETNIITQNIQIILSVTMIGLALGFGLGSRDYFANMLGNQHIKGNFTIGSTIEVGGYKGEIIENTASSIIIDTGEQKVVIPSSELAKSKVIIYS